jgi:hypothetical protein
VDHVLESPKIEKLKAMRAEQKNGAKVAADGKKSS